MKKKFFAAILFICAAVMLSCAFVGCSRTVSGGEMGTVALNKKYIHEEDVGEDVAQQTYFIFTSADTGKYHYYSKYSGEVESYTITFRYKLVGEMANCFFHSVEYDAADNQRIAKSDWTRSLGADTDFLMSASGVYFFNEDFLKEEIPNFGADGANI